MVPLLAAVCLFGVGGQKGLELKTWRASVEADLKREEGWLTVAGLFWLKPGPNTVGSLGSNDIVLPGGPKIVGTVSLADGKATLRVFTGQDVTVNGKAASVDVLRSDADLVGLGSLSFRVITRGKRTGIRLYDSNAKTRREFTGLKWFAPDPAYVIKAKFIAYAKPKMIPITNVLGDTQDVPSPGEVEFVLGGKRLRLVTQSSGEGLFLNFRDATSGKTTYGAGRFLNAPGPKKGFVELDFNKATSPPCAFTRLATCPLPPKGNTLSVAVKAGEKAY